MLWKHFVLVLHIFCNIYEINGLVDLSNLKYYEIVEPSHIDVLSRNKRDLSTKQYHDIHLEETIFEVAGFGRKFKIRLHKNNYLLPQRFVSIYQDENGKPVFDTKPPENCFYHGELEDRNNTFVVFSTCNGLRGLIHDEDGEEFFIEPLHNLDKSHVLYNMKDLKVTKKGLCGNHNHTHSDDHYDFLDHGTVTDHFKRRRRNINNEKKYIETVAVVDNRMFKKWGSSKDKSNTNAMELMNYVDMVYKTLNTRVPLISVIVWNRVDVSKVKENAGETLHAFTKYTKTVVNGDLHLNADNTQLITGVDFTGSLVGLAGIGTICSPSSCGIDMVHSNNPAVAANTIAHEMGHNLGFLHNVGRCKCPNGPCVMGAVAPSKQVKGFTDCTTNTFDKRIKKGGYPCLLDYPDKLFGPAKCGNGYKEGKEACDCGTEADCKASGADKCCDYKTCTLQSSAECADGLCCNACKFKGQGSLCRAQFHTECDLEEFCVGNSSECPRNFYRRDGTDCEQGIGYCYQGMCKTHTEQCEVLWGLVAMKANDLCFTSNTNGDEYGNCGKDLKKDDVKCSVENVLCGKVQCQAKPGEKLPNFPLIGTGRKTLIRTIGGISCQISKMIFMEESGDPTLVQDGIKCGNNSICFEQKCSLISSVSTIKSCNNKCKNGGFCNNNGNCHCPRGFSCPYCEFAGVGGSLDSGQGCVIQDGGSCLTPLVKGLLVLFLLVIPLVALIAFCTYRHKDQLRSRWRTYQQTKSGEVQDTKASKSFMAKGNRNKNDPKMQTGENSKQLQNPYSTENQAPSRPPTSSYNNKPTPFNTNAKALPPIRPGKLQQIDIYNRKDAESRTPQVQIKNSSR